MTEGAAPGMAKRPLARWKTGRARGAIQPLTAIAGVVPLTELSALEY